MIKLKINNINISMPSGTSLLEAAKDSGNDIPVMCFDPNVKNHPSCMVCVVKNKITGEMIPSCSTIAAQGMDIITDDEDVLNARKGALELLLSDHAGDCEAPCRVTCPAYMDIPKMNRLIAESNYTEAIKVVKQEIALPLVLGYICSAPCEKACRRTQVDEAISICQLKKFVALTDLNAVEHFIPSSAEFRNNKIAIIGSGPAGLTSSYHLSVIGYQCFIHESNEKAGGTLLDLSEDDLPKNILEKEIDIIKQTGVSFKLGQTITSEIINNQLSKDYDAIIIAAGAGSNLDIPDGKENIFKCGSFVRPLKMAVSAVAQGKEAALMVDSFISEGKSKPVARTFNSKFGKLKDDEIPEYLKETIEKTPRPQKAKIEDFTENEAVSEAKKCLRCDCRKPHSCKLRKYADMYGANQRRYKYGERKLVRRYFQNDLAVYEPEKCIKCGLCIAITVDMKETNGLAYFGRGFEMRVDIPFNRSLQESLQKSAKKCIETCPTGALANISGE